MSEPLSRRTQRPRGITVQKRETKQPSSTRSAQQEPAHQSPTRDSNAPQVTPTIRLHATMSAKRAPTRAHIQPFCSPSTSRGSRTRTPNRAAHFECAMSTLFHQTGIVKRSTVFYGALVPPVGLEPTRPTERHILSVVCLPIPPQRPKKKGAETNTSNNHATTVRPTSGTHAHQPHHQPAQPACADTLNRPTQTGPNLLTNTESALAQTPKRHPHTPSAHYHAATHPSVTAPAAASIPVLFPLPGRRSRT